MSQPGHEVPLTGTLVHHVDIDSELKLNEIMIPTCSYRMGVANMGYGYATLGQCLDIVCLVYILAAVNLLKILCKNNVLHSTVISRYRVVKLSLIKLLITVAGF